MNILNLSLPIFITITIGILSANFSFCDEKLSDRLASLLFHFMMPMTLFFQISKLSFDKILRWDYIQAYFFSTLIVILFTIICAYKIFHRNTCNILINVMASSYVNTGYLGLPLFLMLFNNILPVASVIMVQTILTFFIFFGLDLSTNNRKFTPINALMVIFRNPIMLGNLCGILFSYAHINIPHTLFLFCKLNSLVTTYLALFTLGLSLGISDFSFDRKQKFEIISLLALKNLLHPALAFAIGHYCFKLNSFLLTALTLMATMPTGKSLFVFARRFRIGADRSSIIVVLSTIISLGLLATAMLTQIFPIGII